ncbi:arsenate reductase (glutaredoxin) [Bacterioplanes sanyensis]|uniref:arsenate reductase (glutaredoxin) n=1 Tax=Bacterioplanes sanyensis TaxID=1249553 RepID=UPI002FCE2583
MSEIQIYHNPRCSKSRQTLALLQEQGIEPVVVEYLKTPPTAAELHSVLSKLNMSPRQLLRRKEAEYKEAGLDNEQLTDEQVIAAMVQYPKLIERPIVIHGDAARIGRPPKTCWRSCNGHALCAGAVLQPSRQNRRHGTTHCSRRRTHQWHRSAAAHCA